MKIAVIVLSIICGAEFVYILKEGYAIAILEATVKTLADHMGEEGKMILDRLPVSDRIMRSIEK